MKLYIMGCGVGFRNRKITSDPAGVKRVAQFSLWGVLAALVFTLLIPFDSAAQSGIITGKVIDAQTGEPLPNAEVGLEGRGQTVVTDRDGRYIIRRVPAGNHSVTVNYKGYASQPANVSIQTGQNVELQVELTGDFEGYIENNHAFVDAARRNQARALNRKNQSENFTTVLTSDQRDRAADYSIQSSVSRIPGVQAGGHGEVNIRGAGLNQYNVTVDGQLMATTGMGDRSMNLDLIPSDLFRNVELIKVLTPDMDADALSGVINLTTYRPVGGGRELDVRFGGGGNAKYFPFTGPASRASIRYSESITDDLGIAVNVNHQQIHRSWESLGIDYDVYDFGDGNTDVLERVAPGLHNDTRNMIAADVQLTYQPSDRTTYSVRSLINSNKREIHRNIDNYSANGDWLRPDTTGRQGNIGRYLHDANLDRMNVQQYLVQASARHLFDAFNLEYRLGWEQGTINRKDFAFPFVRNDLNYSLDMENRSRPQMDITSQHLILEDGFLDRRFVEMGNFGQIHEDHIDNTFSGRIDLEAPVGPATFKVGSSARLTTKTGEYDEVSLTYIRNYRMNRFGHLRQTNFEVMDEYIIPWLINTDDARIFYNAQRPLFTMNPDLHRERSDIWNYEVAENIYGGYGMATVHLGRLTVLGGARVEHTISQYDGRVVVMDENGSFESSDNASTENDYTHILPNAQLAFSPTRQTNIRLAWSQSIRRHDFNKLSPFELVNRRDTTIFRGNPALDPMTSDNLDLMVDQYLGNFGLFSIGAFYKELNNFVRLEERTIEVREGDVIGLDPFFEIGIGPVIPIRESAYRNSGETATIYGVELSWQQSLAFLPGFLRNFGTYANYTWSQSSIDTDRSEDLTLPNHSPHVVNAALDYSQGRISTRISYHWTAEHLISFGQLALAPAISSSEEVYMDQYQDGWSDISVSFRFRISQNFKFWADVFNLSPDRERVRYSHTREYYPEQIDFRGGRSFRAGVRYTF